MKNVLATTCAAALVAVSSFAFAADNSGNNGGNNNGGNNNGAMNGGGVDDSITNSTQSGTQDNKAVDPSCDTAQAQEGCDTMK